MPATADVYAPTSIRRPPPRWRKCLGPCPNEHYFWSADEGEHVCSKGRKLQDKSPLAACETKARVAEGAPC